MLPRVEQVGWRQVGIRMRLLGDNEEKDVIQYINSIQVASCVRKVASGNSEELHEETGRTGEKCLGGVPI